MGGKGLGAAKQVAPWSILCESCSMSEFVNYSNRDVQLPPGCKDLMDVLNLQKATEAPTIAFTATESAASSQSYSGELHQIPDHIARLLSSPKLPNALLIVTHQSCCFWLIYSRKGAPLGLQGAFKEAERLRAVRKFFATRGFTSNVEQLGKNASCFSYAVEETPAPQLIIDLLKAAYGVKDGDRLQFTFVN